LDPYYLADIAQEDGPCYFKHLMMEVEVNPNPEAKAKTHHLKLSHVQLIQKIRAAGYNIKTFNLAILHTTLIASLTSYTACETEAEGRP
jgi:hypothetical protein